MNKKEKNKKEKNARIAFVFTALIAFLGIGVILPAALIEGRLIDFFIILKTTDPITLIIVLILDFVFAAYVGHIGYVISYVGFDVEGYY